MDFSNYKAFLFDVDKTLTNSEKIITQRTITAIQKIGNKNIMCGVCSGRHYATCKDVLDFFPWDSIHVLSGGGEIMKNGGERVFTSRISQSALSEIISLCNRENLLFYAQIGDVVYGNKLALNNPVHTLQTKREIFPQIFPHALLSQCAIIVVHGLDIKGKEKLERIENISCKYMKGYSGNYYADITAKGVSKGSALQEWSKITGIPLSNVVGFGDSENDLEFLQEVGYSVAVGNAIDSVKAIADEVTLDCDHDGVAYWIERNI